MGFSIIFFKKISKICITSFTREQKKKFKKFRNGISLKKKEKKLNRKKVAYPRSTKKNRFGFPVLLKFVKDFVSKKTFSPKKEIE